MKQIQLDKFEKTGGGCIGLSYRSLDNPDILLKMYDNRVPLSEVELELELSQKVYDLGISTPEPGEIVTDGNFYGVLYKYISGKRSFARMISDEPQRLEEYARYYARLCKQLHSVSIPDGCFIDLKPLMISYLESDIYFNDKEKQQIADMISAFPDSDKALQGDMHFGNVICTLPFGQPLNTPHNYYYIDLSSFTRGYYMLDIAMLYIVCNVMNGDIVKESYHITAAQAKDVWGYFVDEYFQGQYSLDEFNCIIKPFSGLKFLMIEHLAGLIMPEHLEYMRNVLNL